MVPELAKHFGVAVVTPAAIPIKQEEPAEPPQPGVLNRAPGAPVATPPVVNIAGKPLSKVQTLLQVAESKGLLVHISHYPKVCCGFVTHLLTFLTNNVIKYKNYYCDSNNNN